LQISGIYPHLAVFNDSGGDQDRECGIGAVVVWAGRLWLMTYPPHRRTGSPDKLYEIDDRLQMTVRPESVGGTHAGRMIHRETQQLVMGPYFIDASGQVRAVDQTKGFAARITAVARHLTDPARKVYMIDMEGPIWEVDVRTLEATRLFVKPVPGWHAKGGYTGQGRLIVANNGGLRTADLDKLQWEAPEDVVRGPEDAGVLAEFDGTTWTIVARRPHTEVTGPGGLQGEPAPMRLSGAWAGINVAPPAGPIERRVADVRCRREPPTIHHTAGSPSGRGSGDRRRPFLLNMHGTFSIFRRRSTRRRREASARSPRTFTTRPTSPSGTDAWCSPATTPRSSRISWHRSRSRTCGSWRARLLPAILARRSAGEASGSTTP
jgi:hypothetical protein